MAHAPPQSFPDLLGSLATLTAVELVYERVPGHAILALSPMTDLQRRTLDLLGLKSHPAPSLASPSEAGPPWASAGS